MPVLYTNRPEIQLAPSGQTSTNGVIGHPLQKAGVIPYHGTTPINFKAFQGIGTSLSHVLKNLSRRGGSEGSGTL